MTFEQWQIVTIVFLLLVGIPPAIADYRRIVREERERQYKKWTGKDMP